MSFVRFSSRGAPDKITLHSLWKPLGLVFELNRLEIEPRVYWLQSGRLNYYTLALVVCALTGHFNKFSLQINFFDIIAEPEGSHSFNTIWGTSYKVYSVTKFWLYRILTLLFGIPCSLFWGIYFACLAFIGVWWITPCIKAFSIKVSFKRSFFAAFLLQCYSYPGRILIMIE